MKVTFVIYNHTDNSISLVKSVVEGNKPKEDEWDRAANSAKSLIAEQYDKKLTEWIGAPRHGTYSVSSVLKGWVDFEDRAPIDLG